MRLRLSFAMGTFIVLLGLFTQYSHPEPEHVRHIWEPGGSSEVGRGSFVSIIVWSVPRRASEPVCWPHMTSQQHLQAPSFDCLEALTRQTSSPKVSLTYLATAESSFLVG